MRLNGLTSFYGLKEAATQTDLTINDLSRIEDIFKAQKSYLTSLEYPKSNPFTSICQGNTTLLKNVKEDNNKPLRNPLHTTKVEASKRKKKTYKDIKIYNSVVVNNNDPELRNLLKRGSDLNYSQKIFDLLNTNKVEKDNEEESSEIEINTMLNQMRGKEDKKFRPPRISSFTTQLVESKSKQKDSEPNNNSDDKEENERDSESLLNNNISRALHLKRKRFFSKTENIIPSLTVPKEPKSIQQATDCEEVKKSIGRPLAKYQEENYLFNTTKQLTKRKYDPFNLFLDEFKQHQSDLTKIKDIEKEAKDQWLKLDKETKKLYNLLADREKKLQKQKNKQNKENDQEVDQEDRKDQSIENSICNQ